MNRHKFSDIFQENLDGSLKLRVRISVNGIEFDSGIISPIETSLGGVNFYLYRNLDIATEEQDGILIIKGFYRR
jgi:hypothetical protein